MSCLCCLFFEFIQLIVIYAYPGYKIIKNFQKKELQKIWIIYFLIVGIYSICEKTILFPLIIILGKIGRKIYPIIKILFHLWLYIPEYRGALLINQQNGELISKIFIALNPLLGKILSNLGIDNKDPYDEMKKNEWNLKLSFNKMINDIIFG